MSNVIRFAIANFVNDENNLIGWITIPCRITCYLKEEGFTNINNSELIETITKKISEPLVPLKSFVNQDLYKLPLPVALVKDSENEFLISATEPQIISKQFQNVSQGVLDFFSVLHDLDIDYKPKEEQLDLPFLS